MRRTTEKASAPSGRDRLPVHAMSAQIIMEMLNGPRSDLRDLGRAIQIDPALTAAVLRAANSAHLGYSRRIGGIRHAMVLLGDSLVASLAASRVADLIFDDDPPIYLDWLWPHSLATGSACSVLAKWMGESTDEAFTVGLLHDVGWLLAMSNRELLQTDQIHAQRGSELLGRWNLPDSVVNAVGHHHLRPAALTTVGERIIVAGHAFAAEVGATGPEPAISSTEALRLLDLDIRPSVIIADVERELAVLTAGFADASGSAGTR